LVVLQWLSVNKIDSVNGIKARLKEVTKSDRVIIQRIKQFAKQKRLEKIEEKMEMKKTIADMFGIDDYYIS
jgi:hypothetical protein